jgi:hypothetical protein
MCATTHFCRLPGSLSPFPHTHNAQTNPRGVIHRNSKLLLGPDGLGFFVPVVVKSIHCKDTDVAHVVAGQEATFALRLENGERVGAVSEAPLPPPHPTPHPPRPQGSGVVLLTRTRMGCMPHPVFLAYSVPGLVESPSPPPAPSHTHGHAHPHMRTHTHTHTHPRAARWTTSVFARAWH